jgi:SPX domain protein involved in polyphosphate accumulation
MRTAFQIPFDATVRISLDTNLCMIAERTEDVLSGQRWYRDPNKPVPLNEITRFPHAVLEIKLQLEDENMTPPWVTTCLTVFTTHRYILNKLLLSLTSVIFQVTELLNSGMVLEVHKFSKFIHGCAVLMPDEVVAVPYWIDDLTLIDSINKSGAAKILEKNVGANQQYKHLLPHGAKGLHHCCFR